MKLIDNSSLNLFILIIIIIIFLLNRCDKIYTTSEVQLSVMAKLRSSPILCTVPVTKTKMHLTWTMLKTSLYHQACQQPA